MVIRTYGSIKAQSPTGMIREYYKNANEAKLSVERIIRQKEKKGYQNQSNNKVTVVCIRIDNVNV
jgi:predicted DNA-binding WGR domain protein